jgi:hypothetical protein
VKLGLAYNLFDGEELMIDSLMNLSGQSDYVCIVYQTTSNFNQKNIGLHELVNEYVAMGLVNDVYHYNPKIIYDSNRLEIKKFNGLNNEIEKRKIGLKLCKSNGCTHFLNLDCDEFYDISEFSSAKSEIEKYDYDTSFCQMNTYYKRPDLMVYPHENYYAPFIYKIKKDTQFSFEYWNNQYPAKIDPTRRVKAGYSRIFNRDELIMYHYAYVRRNINSKVFNTSSQVDFEQKQKVINHWNNFKNEKDGALFIGDVKHNLVKTENKFNIEI